MFQGHWKDTTVFDSTLGFGLLPRCIEAGIGNKSQRLIVSL